MTDSKWVPIRDTIERIALYGAKFFFPMLAGIAPILGLPAWIGRAAGIIVPQLMAMAEADFPAPGSGPMKKAKVLSASEKIMAILEAEFTGGAAGSFAKMKPAIELLIDGTVSVTNALAPQIIANDAPGNGINVPIDSP